MHNELLLSPLITNNPEEADFFYIPIHPFACRVTEFLRKNDELIKEIRSLGPWYDRKKGSDHIVVSGFEAAYGDSPFSTSITKDNFIIASPNPQRLDSWRTWHGQRNIIIPFVSHFKNFTFSDVNWTRKRNNTVYLAHSYNVLPLDAQALRKKVTDAVSKIKRKELIVFTRRPYRVVSIVRSLPEKMTNADFCVCVRGDLQLPNKRVFDAINLGCIPVLISDNVSLPFAHNLLDYSKFTIRIPEKDVDKIPEILESYSQSQIQEMRNELKKAAKVLRFRVGQPPVVGEAFWAFSWMLYIRHMYKLQYDGIFYPAKLPNYKKI
ncbi:Exostosin family protein [Histomonas meleagridis]|uniref:Exostosin family protein n=1 Tax=Histomonas meleagridis TaxID=135588 RepID=UPI00355AC33C|nr:Exostosin family protein [Histomonas meleagridis]KAH0806713.1 Exostosin family protein [Histomonas meleagridis]